MRCAAAVPEIQAAAARGRQAGDGLDQSIYVKRSIKEAEETLVLAAILVVIIIFLFLRNVRATIIPGLAIPTSIVATFAIMYCARLLDQQPDAAGADAGHRHRGGRRDHRAGERLPPPGGAGRDRRRQAAIDGTREIGFAVIATTISLMAVFTPLAFLKGDTGRLFNEFGIAVAGAVVISGFVALTLTPMLCARSSGCRTRAAAEPRPVEPGRCHDTEIRTRRWSGASTGWPPATPHLLGGAAPPWRRAGRLRCRQRCSPCSSSSSSSASSCPPEDRG